MRSLKYLNGVLTLIAVLLTLNLWTAWTSSPGGDVMSLSHQSQAAGVGSGAKIQKDSLDELKAINKSVAKVKSMLSSGDAKVKVENLPKGD